MLPHDDNMFHPYAYFRDGLQTRFINAQQNRVGKKNTVFYSYYRPESILLLFGTQDVWGERIFRAHFYAVYYISYIMYLQQTIADYIHVIAKIGQIVN